MGTKKIIITLLVLAVLVGGGIWAGIALTKRNNTATAVVTLNRDGGTSASEGDGRIVELNDSGTATSSPSVQLVVNANGKVLSTVHLNADADTIYASIDVTGKSVDEACAEYADAVIKTGAFSLNVSAQQSKNIFSLVVSSSDTKQAESIKSSVTAKIDAKFDASGIYGAVKSEILTQTADLKAKYNKIANSLYMDAQEFEGKTEAEIVSLINEQSKKYQDITASELAKIETDFDLVNKAIIDAITTAENQIDTQTKLVASLELKINNFEASVNLGISLDGLKAQLETAKTKLQEAKAELEKEKAELEAKLKEYLKTLKTESEQLIKAAKENYAKVVDNFKGSYETYKANFEKDATQKESTLKSISDWRLTIEISASSNS